MEEEWGRYKPTRQADLCTNLKKVETIRQWLTFQIDDARKVKEKKNTPGAPKVLVLSGPTGTGKRTVVDFLCDELNVEVLTWNTPAPTLWAEHKYLSGFNAEYTSKMEEFENFLKRATLFSPLAISGSHSEAQSWRKVIVIDDLPSTHGVDQHARLLAVLKRYAFASRFAVVICLSNLYKVEEGDNQGYFHDRLLRSLEDHGAFAVAFPPVTVARMTKALQAAAERQNLASFATKDWLKSIAESSGGDIRHAMLTLQFSALGVPREPTTKQKLKQKKRKRVAKEAGDLVPKLDSLPTNHLGKDREIELFHALGKILYNKRTATPDDALSLANGDLQERYRRDPSENAVDNVIAKTHLDPAMVLGYLEENFLHFVHDDAIDEAAEMLGYFSQSDLLNTNKGGDGPFGSGPLTSGSMVSVLGYQFCNCSNAPRTFHQMRKPANAQVERVKQMNQAELSRTALARARQCFYSEPRETLVTQTLPYLKSIAHHHIASPSYHVYREQLPGCWHSIEGGGSLTQSSYLAPPFQSEMVRDAVSEKTAREEDEEEDEIEPV